MNYVFSLYIIKRIFQINDTVYKCTHPHRTLTHFSK